MIGTSHSIDEGDGSETVTIKTSSRFHKLCGVYSNSLNYWVPHQVQTTKKRHTASCLYVLHNSSHKALSRRGRAGRAKKFRNVPKSVLHVQNYCFA